MEFDRQQDNRQAPNWRTIRLLLNGVMAPSNGVLLGLTGYLSIFGPEAAKTVLPNASASDVQTFKEFLIGTTSFFTGSGLTASGIVGRLRPRG